MGSQTADWKYMSMKRDFDDLHYYKMLYRQGYAYEFAPQSETRIPQVIHLIWLGPRAFPIASLPYIRSWLTQHPGWTLYFWTDRPRLPPAQGCQIRYVDDFDFKFLKEQYAASKNWGEKSDLLRYEILLAEGGVYIDHDASCLRSFDLLHRGYDFYACLEVPHEAIDDLVLTAGNGVIGSIPHHPIILETIQTVLRRWERITRAFSAQDPWTQARLVTYRTYICLTHALKNRAHLFQGRSIVFPASYFYPKKELKGIYSRHFYSSAWHDLNFSSSELALLSTMSQFKKEATKTLRLEWICLIAIIGSCILFVLSHRLNKRSLKH